MSERGVPAAPREQTIRKVAFAALGGTSIEWYDFFLYGTAAALIFPKVFFSSEMPVLVALLASFSTFAVGFIARPIGGVIFGHFGDKVGRKKTLVTALLLMGAATTLIGCLPTYAQVGPLASVLLIALRFAQGLAIGGQWAGAALLVTESAPADKRGFYGSFAQAGAPVGTVLANLAFLAVTATLTPEAFMSWGWRLPFLASIALIVLALYVQLKLEETAAFRELQASQQKAARESTSVVAKSPVLEVLRSDCRIICLAAGAFICIAMMYGPQAAFLSELFGTRLRYSGASLAYQLGAIAGGALAPLIATAILARYGDPLGISVYIAMTCLITVLAMMRLPETHTPQVLATAPETRHA